MISDEIRLNMKPTLLTYYLCLAPLGRCLFLPARGLKVNGNHVAKRLHGQLFRLTRLFGLQGDCGSFFLGQCSIQVNLCVVVQIIQIVDWIWSTALHIQCVYQAQLSGKWEGRYNMQNRQYVL